MTRSGAPGSLPVPTTDSPAEKAQTEDTTAPRIAVPRMAGSRTRNARRKTMGFLPGPPGPATNGIANLSDSSCTADYKLVTGIFTDAFQARPATGRYVVGSRP